MNINQTLKSQILTPSSSGAKTEKARSAKTSAAASGKAENAETQPSAVTGDNLQTGNKQKIMQALQNEPDVRADVVARAKALAADGSYPSDDVLSHVAKLFVKDAAKQK